MNTYYHHYTSTITNAISIIVELIIVQLLSLSLLPLLWFNYMIDIVRNFIDFSINFNADIGYLSHFDFQDMPHCCVRAPVDLYLMRILDLWIDMECAQQPSVSFKYFFFAHGPVSLMESSIGLYECSGTTKFLSCGTHLVLSMMLQAEFDSSPIREIHL